MTTLRVTLNRAGVAEVAKSSEMKALMAGLAEQVASSVREQGIKVGDRDGGSHEYDLPVKVAEQVTDRARATVTLAHPAGVAVQAKHGVLTKAASAAGLQVKGS